MSSTTTHEKTSLLRDRIESAKYNEVPVLLLQLEPVPKTTTNVSILWKCGLFDWLSNALIRDYLKVPEGWKTAARIANITAECCQVRSPDSAQKLSTVATNFVTLLQNIRKEIRLTSDQSKKSSLENNFRSVCSSLSAFCTVYRSTIAPVVESIYGTRLLQFEPKIYSSALDRSLILCVAEIAKPKPDVLTPKGISNIFALHEHLVERLTQGSDSDVAKACIEMLLKYLQTKPVTLDLFRKRFSNLSPSLNKWKGKGLDRSLLHFQRLLESESPESLQLQKSHKAAAKIAAFWRAHKTRRDLARMKAGFILLQRFYRWRLFRVNLEHRIASKLANKKLDQAQRLCKNSRAYQERRYNAIAGLHPTLVDRFLAEEMGLWATRIQSFYRGFRARQIVKKMESERKTDGAARVIQRAMKILLQKRRSQKARFNQWPGLTDERREELQTIVDGWREEVIEHKSVQQQHSVHEQAQKMLAQHLFKRHDDLRSFGEREALMAKAKIDIDLLQSAPRLSHITTRDLIIYRSHGQTVQSLAEKRFNNLTRQSTLPWWKLISDERFTDVL